MATAAPQSSGVAPPFPRVVITGVAGFVGSLIARELCESGATVVGIDSFVCGYEHNLAWVRPEHRFTLHRVCIAKDAAVVRGLLEAGDVVLHLAAITALAQNQEDPGASYVNNVASTAALLESARVVGAAHFVFASTSAVYEHALAYPVAEDAPRRAPDLVYSLGKAHCEDLVRAAHGVYGLPYTIMRFFNVFGPGADGARAHPPLVPYLIRELRAGRPPVLHSDGSQRRDYIYVADLTRLMRLLFAHGPLNTEINLCSGRTHSVREIVTVVQAALGGAAAAVEPVYRDPALLWEKADKLWAGARPFPAARMREEVEKYCLGDGARAKALLGWVSHRQRRSACPSATSSSVSLCG